MKNILREYIELSDQEKTRLWTEGIFVFDTNVLLNLYRYTKKTRDVLFEALNSLQERIWLPYNVVEEYYKNRCETIYETVGKYDKISKCADDFAKECQNALRLDNQDKELNELNNYIQKWLTKEKSSNLLVINPSQDAILDNLLDLFDNRVGKPFDEASLEAIRLDGSIRYNNKIPPGYKDAKKQSGTYENNMYGDLIVWKQILDYSKEMVKDINFVTHDQKDDWWNKESGKTIGPRYELKKEFMDYTGKTFHMYSMNSFIAKFNEQSGIRTDQRILEEVKQIDKDKKMTLKQIKYIDNKQINNMIWSKKHKLNKQEIALMQLQEKYKNKPKPDDIVLQMFDLTKNIELINKELAVLSYKKNY